MLKNLNEENMDENKTIKKDDIIDKFNNIKDNKNHDEFKELLIKSIKKGTHNFYVLLFGILFNVVVLGINFYNSHLDRVEKKEEQLIKSQQYEQSQVENIKNEKYNQLDSLVNIQTKELKSLQKLLLKEEFLLSDYDPKMNDFKNKFDDIISDIINEKSDLVSAFGEGSISIVYSDYTTSINQIESEVLKSKKKFDSPENIKQLRRIRDKLEDYFTKIILDTKNQRNKYTTVLSAAVRPLDNENSSHN